MTLSFGTGSGMTDKNSFAVTNGAMIARNAAWNLFGLGVPMLVAVFSIPMLVRTLGVDRFGILSIVWMVIGYFSLFDFGLGRALTQVIAKKLGSRRPEEVPDIFWAATFLMLILGLAGAVAGAGLASWLVTSLLNVPPQLQRETLQAFYLLAVAIPVNITSIGFRGALEAHQQFRLTSIMRVIMGLVTFLVPLGVLGFSHSLVAVVAALLAGRTVVLIIYLVLCLRVIPNLGDAIAVKRAALPPLLRIGGWMTVSNMVSPLMATLDRFFLGSMVSMAAVTFYSTPFDTVTKLLIIPSALTGVIFPAFAASSVTSPARTSRIYYLSLACIFFGLFPIALITIVMAREGLDLWLGADFAGRSTHVLQWIAFGVLANSVAQVPFALVQGSGRSDLTAKLHLVELPLYLITIWLLVQRYGIEGAAMAWTIRVTVDLGLLLATGRQLLPIPSAGTWRNVWTAGAAATTLGLGALPSTLAEKTVFLIIALAVYVGIARTTLPDEIQHAVVGRLPRSIRNLGPQVR